MTLTRSDISHLAELARLHVSDEEADRLQRDLTQIVGFIDRASAEDASSAPPMIHPSGAEDGAREDAADVSGVGRSVRQAARTEDGYVRVPPVGGMRQRTDHDGESIESPGESNG